MPDAEEIKAETERLVGIANDRLVQSVKHSERRVLKAEWDQEKHRYCLTLECAHTTHATEPYLRSPLMCLDCIREKLL